MANENILRANERLREERMRRGWSQQKLADELGIAVVTVNRWERGKQQPAGYYRLKLTTLFEKSAEELGLVEGQAEVVSPVYAKEPQENENEVVSAFQSERNDQVKDTIPLFYETPSEKPLLERETTRRSLSSSYAQFGTPLLKRRGRTLLLLLVLILLVIVAPITFVRIYSTGAKTKMKSTPLSSFPTSFTVPSTWKIALNDPLTAAHHNSQWVDDGSQCIFHSDGYYATSQGPNYCNYGDHITDNFSDMAYSIAIKFYKGSMGGLIFRLHSSTDGSCVGNCYYGFYITTTGEYRILWHTDAKGGTDTTLAYHSFSAIHKNFQQTNILSVLARGNIFTFWINKKYVTTLNNNTYKSGTIGVYVGNPNDSSTITDALFNNAEVWIP